MRHTLDIGVTNNEATRIRGLYTFCLLNPESTTYTTPSIVNDVSAILVEITIFRPGFPFLASGADSKIRCCFFGGNDEYNGNT